MLRSDDRLACVTLDLEADFDGVVAGDELLGERLPEVARAAEALARYPVSTFARTDLLTRWHTWPDALQRLVSRDPHAHSHSHRLDPGPGEFVRARDAFAARFGRPPLGYRAPLGRLRPGDAEALHAAGYSFSSSITPTRVPGWYDHRRHPAEPFRHACGLLELPLATVSPLRLPLNPNWSSLYGPRTTRWLLDRFGLPDVVVLHLHLHDLIRPRRSFAQLPLRYRLALGRASGSGQQALDELVAWLQRREHRLVTMSELYGLVGTTQGRGPSQTMGPVGGSSP